MTKLNVQWDECKVKNVVKYGKGTIFKFNYDNVTDPMIGTLIYIHSVGWNIVMMNTGESWTNKSIPGATHDRWTQEQIEDAFGITIMNIVKSADIKLTFEKE